MKALDSSGLRRPCDSVDTDTEEFIQDIGRDGFDHD
jgi:hypothetical protein